MKNALPIFAKFLNIIGLSLWLGGLIAIGALVAPTAFSIVRVNPVFAGNATLQAQIAGGIVGGSLRHFNVLCYACGVLLILANILLWPNLNRPGRIAAILSVAATVILLGTALYQGFSLFPTMDTAQAQGNMPLFDSLHHRYEALAIQLQFPLLLVLAALTAWRDSISGASNVPNPTVRTTPVP